MASGMWKKLLRPKIEKISSHQAFIAAYTALKPIWLEEQSKAIKLSPDEQRQISLKQNDALKTLIFNCGLDEKTYSKNYPVPLLTNNDLNLELKQYEKDLDDTFRKEVGKIIPLLKEHTIHGVEKYLATFDKALLSLAKTQARKDILDRLSVYYVPTLIKLDKGLITYYNQHLNNRDPDESYTLTSTFMDIIDLMERDGHRARLGEAIYPPKQMNNVRK
uniref:Uncharacterized protein n=1 Tax=Strongyloides papillosus TaxID=174720 RepID=A0A0N5CI89_STREA